MTQASIPAMRHRSPVFIVGEARSGTSILYRTLQKHPSFAPKRVDLTETEIFALLRRVFMFRKDYPDQLMRFMLYDRDVWNRFIRSIRPGRIANALWLPANLLTRNPPPWLWHANLHHLTLRSYFLHAREARGCRRLVEKTPTNTFHLPHLKRTFPDARFLYVHRHPVEVFASYRRRVRDDPGAGWADIGIEEFCDRYETSTSAVLAWLASGRDDLRMVSYERFTSDPSGSFRDICRFLDEPFESSALVENSPDPHRWRGDPYLWGPIVTMTKRWTDHVSESEASSIEARLAPIMNRLGYRSYLA
jgi:hypothetical protein